MRQYKQIGMWAGLGLLSFILMACGSSDDEETITANCGDRVTRNVRLTGNLADCSGDGIVIGADNIVIDLDGFAITGTGAADSAGIRNTGFNGVRIEDGTIENFFIGVLLDGAGDTRVRSLTIRNHMDIGVALMNSASNSLIDQNQILSNALGIGVFNSDGNTFENNDVNDSTASDGMFLQDADDTIIRQNEFIGNMIDGIVVLENCDGTVIERNVANDHSDDGIEVLSQATTLTENTANNNGNLGIEAVDGVTDGGGNQARGNGNPDQCVNVLCM